MFPPVGFAHIFPVGFAVGNGVFAGAPLDCAVGQMLSEIHQQTLVSPPEPAPQLELTKKAFAFPAAPPPGVGPVALIALGEMFAVITIPDQGFP